MSGLSRRLQVLVTDGDFLRLEALARLRGESIGAVVRSAIAQEMSGTDDDRRRRAGARILALETPDDGGPEPDWPTLKREMLDGWGAPPA